ncbi:hypothetical protein ILYODFUR_039026 [Ilyodon furcidens]|uniref:Uncharacterized protein n=1 Tax=Ilyodon furcidens TaxID=33524 RepID=A0ABV0THA4_9TELE
MKLRYFSNARQFVGRQGSHHVFSVQGDAQKVKLLSRARCFLLRQRNANMVENLLKLQEKREAGSIRRKSSSRCRTEESLTTLRRLQQGASDNLLNRRGLLLHPNVNLTAKQNDWFPFAPADATGKDDLTLF